MNNNQYFKLMYSLMDDTRMNILGSQFGDNEALGLWVRLLKVLYKDYPEGIPYEDFLLEHIATACKTDLDTLKGFVELCCSRAVGWLAIIDSVDEQGNTFKKLLSHGVAKEQLELEAAREAGSRPPKPGSRPRGRPKKGEA